MQEFEDSKRMNLNLGNGTRVTPTAFNRAAVVAAESGFAV